MHQRLLDTDIQQFILEHERDDKHSLVLKYKDVNGFPIGLIADQINGRQKAKTKLPSFYNASNIIYPAPLNLEQSTSEAVARFKTAVIKKLPIEKRICADVTGGLGVDTYFLSKVFEKVIYIEPQLELLEIARHNHRQLGATNIDYYKTSAEHYLETLSSGVDLIYVDPSRRKDSKKVHRFSDCDPDVKKLSNLMTSKSGFTLIKSSPMQDIHQGIKELKSVAEVFVVSTDNDCKEVLFLCCDKTSDKPLIHSFNIHGEITEVFSFSFSEEQMSPVSFSEPKEFLYEPNSAILKAGAFNTIAKRFKLAKLHSNTHLYTSDSLIDDFPGRTFKVTAFVAPKPNVIKRYLPDMKANVTTRNYPLSVARLKEKIKVKDGGDAYIIGFASESKNYLVVASRITQR